MFSEEDPTAMKCPSCNFVSGGIFLSMPCSGDVSLHHLGKVVFAKFFTIKFLIFSCVPQFWGSESLSPAHHQRMSEIRALFETWDIQLDQEERREWE